MIITIWNSRNINGISLKWQMKIVHILYDFIVYNYLGNEMSSLSFWDGHK